MSAGALKLSNGDAHPVSLDAKWTSGFGISQHKDKVGESERTARHAELFARS